MKDSRVVYTQKLSKTLRLEDSTEIEEISFVEPLVRDFEAIDSVEGGTTRDIELLVKISKTPVTPDDVRNLPMKDFSAIQRRLTSFLLDPSDAVGARG